MTAICYFLKICGKENYMSWGINIELYLLHKENEENVDFQKSRHLPAVSIPGENWTDEEVEASSVRKS